MILSPEDVHKRIQTLHVYNFLDVRRATSGLLPLTSWFREDAMIRGMNHVFLYTILTAKLQLLIQPTASHSHLRKSYIKNVTTKQATSSLMTPSIKMIQNLVSHACQQHSNSGP